MIGGYLTVFRNNWFLHSRYIFIWWRSCSTNRLLLYYCCNIPVELLWNLLETFPNKNICPPYLILTTLFWLFVVVNFLCLSLCVYKYMYIRGGADKSLDWPTSLRRRTKSIVSLERGVCSCSDLQVFLVTETERKHVRRRARFQQHRDASFHQVYIQW